MVALWFQKRTDTDLFQANELTDMIDLFLMQRVCALKITFDMSG
jgi:hypothetical protein